MKVRAGIDGRQVAWFLSVLSLALAGLSCGRHHRKIDSSTNWLRVCDSNAECGPLSCLCGVCNTTCSGDDGCGFCHGADCSLERRAKSRSMRRIRRNHFFLIGILRRMIASTSLSGAMARPNAPVLAMTPTR